MREKCFSPYSGYPEVSIDFNPKDPKSKSRTQQHFAEEVEINNIIERFNKSGVLVDSSVDSRRAVFGDFSSSEQYHVLLNQINIACDSFMKLPAEIRAKFNNDPALLIDFLNELPKNFKSAYEMGFITKAEYDSYCRGVPADAGTEAAAKAAATPEATASNAAAGQ